VISSEFRENNSQCSVEVARRIQKPLKKGEKINRVWYIINGTQRASPWSPKAIPTYAKASVGHPPVSEIRQSMIDPLLKVFLSGVTHSSTNKVVVPCVGGLKEWNRG